MTGERKPRDAVREFLDSVREARIDYDRAERKIGLLRSKCENITASLTGMPSGGGVGASGLWAALADEHAGAEAQMAAARQREREVEAFIDSLPTAADRTILKLRYLDLLRWPDVMRQLQRHGMYYTERQVFRQHGTALNAARRVWAETHREEDDT